MSSYSKKFVNSFLRDSVNTQIIHRVTAITGDMNLMQNPYSSYTIIHIDPYEQSPIVVVHQIPSCSNVIIDIE